MLKRQAGEFEKYIFFCTAYLSAQQKLRFAQHVLNTLRAELVSQDIEALRSVLDSCASYLGHPFGKTENKQTSAQWRGSEMLRRAGRKTASFPLPGRKPEKDKQPQES